MGTFWCLIHHSIFKVNTLIDRPTQLAITTSVTLVACLPSCLLLWLKPIKVQFLLSLVCSCFAFFLFSMQVHEKQILSPLLMFSLVITARKEMMWCASAVQMFALFSMYKLIVGDFNYVNYIVMMLALALFDLKNRTT